MCNKCKLHHLISNGTIQIPSVSVSPGESTAALFHLVDRNEVTDDPEASNVSFTADLELLTLDELLVYAAQSQMVQQYFAWVEKRLVNALADRAVATHPEGLADFKEKTPLDQLPDEVKDLLREMGIDDV